MILHSDFAGKDSDKIGTEKSCYTEEFIEGSEYLAYNSSKENDCITMGVVESRTDDLNNTVQFKGEDNATIKHY